MTTEYLICRPSEKVEAAESRLEKMTAKKSVVPHIDMPRAVMRCLLGGAAVQIDGDKYKLLAPGDEIEIREGKGTATRWQLMREVTCTTLGSGIEDIRTYWIDAGDRIEDLLDLASTLDGKFRDDLFKETFLASAQAALQKDAKLRNKQRDERAQISETTRKLVAFRSRVELIELSVRAARQTDYDLNISCFVTEAADVAAATKSEQIASLVSMFANLSDTAIRNTGSAMITGSFYEVSSDLLREINAAIIQNNIRRANSRQPEHEAA